ncbi:MAG: branched-chain amino acid ABC transporter permease [Ilumatobacteraceae bacterium]|nr:branched-chain amino acid ABC transporter permease [Ilumatobacteraceae bacterium]
MTAQESAPTIQRRSSILSRQFDHANEVKLLQTRPQRVTRVLTLIFLLVLPFLLATDFSPPLDFPWATWFTVVNFAIIASIGAVAMNLLSGYAGQVSVAHVAFLIVGSIVGAQFGEIWGVPFWFLLPLAAFWGALIGVIVGLPALRVRGLYLFMATLAVHFIAIFIFRRYQVDQFGFSGIVYTAPTLPDWLLWIPGLDEGANGEFTIRGNWRWYWLNLGVAALCIGFAANLLRTSWGRAFIAVRENDAAAAFMGVNVTRVKLLVFSASSGLVAVSGVLASYYLGARSDESWTLEIVLDYVTMIVVGGFGSLLGGVFGAVFFYVTPVLLSWVRELPFLENIEWLQEHGHAVDQMMYGLCVVLVLLFKPSGIAGMWEDTRDAVGRFVERRKQGAADEQ